MKKRIITMFKIINEVLQNMNNPKLIGNLGISKSFDDLYGHINECLDLAQPKMLVEMGTNAGHSAVMFLEHKKDLKVYSYDIVIKEYVIPCAQALEKHYGDRFTFEKANTHELDSIPDCDMTHIDGDHSYEGVKNDIELSLKAGAEWILLDDMNQEPMYKAATEFGMTEVKRFDYKQHKAGRIGTMILFKV